MLIFTIIILLIAAIGGYYLFDKYIGTKIHLLQDYTKLIDNKKNELSRLDKEINKNESFIYYQNDISRELEEEIESFKIACNFYKQEALALRDNMNTSLEEYSKDVSNHKEELEQSIYSLMNNYVEKAKQLQQIIKGYEDKIKAYIEEQKRKEEMTLKVDFYRLKLSDNEMSDVIKLIEISSSVNQPDVLKKLIYKTYFEKKMNDLLGRVVGANSEITGIYKITHIDSGKSYIGQTVNMKDRWRTHLKRGLGIDAPASNKFYQSMYELKPWNFTWEVLESCKKEELNEKEKYWIDFHQTNSWGWNSKGGNR